MFQFHRVSCTQNKTPEKKTVLTPNELMKIQITNSDYHGIRPARQRKPQPEVECVNPPLMS